MKLTRSRFQHMMLYNFVAIVSSKVSLKRASTPDYLE